jgi:hypothetical protein
VQNQLQRVSSKRPKAFSSTSVPLLPRNSYSFLPQQYKDHLKGTKHKQKKAAAKAGAAASLPRGSSALHCDVCDVICAGSVDYAAHIRGTKHQRVVRLHMQLWKPIPALEPEIISNKDEDSKQGRMIIFCYSGCL